MVTEDEVAGWHHRLIGHKSEQALGDSEEKGSLVCTVHEVAKSWTQLLVCFVKNILVAA